MTATVLSRAVVVCCFGSLTIASRRLCVFGFVGCSWKVVDAYRLELYRCLASSMLVPVAAASGSSAGSTEAGMLATFSLLPYAVPVFRRAAAHDDAESVRALVSQSLRLASALVHPRALALSQRSSAFVQDASLAPMGDEHADAGEMQHDESSANRLGQGLVRGRDGSLYMKMAETQEEQEEQPQQEAAQQQQQQDYAAAAGAAAASSSSFHASPAASAIPAPAPVAVQLAGSKRSRDVSQDEAQPMQLDADEPSAVHASKRAHVDKPAAAIAAAAADSEASASVALVDDDETDADAAALTVADDGPDADEGEQGSLWNL